MFATNARIDARRVWSGVSGRRVALVAGAYESSTPTTNVGSSVKAKSHRRTTGPKRGVGMGLTGTYNVGFISTLQASVGRDVGD